MKINKKKGKKKKQLSKAIQIKELDKSNNEKEITDNRASCRGLKILQKKPMFLMYKKKFKL